MSSKDRPRNRERILPEERRLRDRQMVERLQSMRESPIRTTDRMLVDVDLDLGRVFGNASKRERWVFASVAAERAAAAAAAFDLFSEAGDLTDLRHFVLRPRGKKVIVDELQEAIRKLSDDYNKHVGRLVSAGLVAPLLCVIHVRYDHDLGVFDLHAHCIWRVAPDKMDAVLKGVQTKFSTVWMDKKPIRKPAALANYLLTWIIDHRDLQDWPRDAVLALWHLKRPRFIRSAGAFAEFRADLRDYRLVREDGAVVAVPVQRRAAPATRRSAKELKTGSVVGFVQAKLMGQLRWCAIAVVKGGERLTRRHIEDILAQSTRAARKAYYPTTTTGLSPLPANPPPNDTQTPAAPSAPVIPDPISVEPPVSQPPVSAAPTPTVTARVTPRQKARAFVRVVITKVLKLLAWLTPRSRRRTGKSLDPGRGSLADAARGALPP